MALNFMMPQVGMGTPGIAPGQPPPQMPMQPAMPEDQQSKLARILPAIINAVKGGQPGGMPPQVAPPQQPNPVMNSAPVATPPIQPPAPPPSGVPSGVNLPSEADKKPSLFNRVQKAASTATGFNPDAKGIGGFAQNLSSFLGSGGKDDKALTKIAHMAPPPPPVSLGQNLTGPAYQNLYNKPPTLGMGGAPMQPRGLMF